MVGSVRRAPREVVETVPPADDVDAWVDPVEQAQVRALCRRARRGDLEAGHALHKLGAVADVDAWFTVGEYDTGAVLAGLAQFRHLHHMRETR